MTPNSIHGHVNHLSFSKSLMLAMSVLITFLEKREYSIIHSEAQWSKAIYERVCFGLRFEKESQ